MEKIIINHIKPHYIHEKELQNSDIYLQKFTLIKGEKYLLKSTSGKGKSSFLNIVFGINNSFEGGIEYVPERSSDWKKTQMSYVFQDLKLFEELSLIENIEIKNSLTNHKTKDEIESYISQLGLADKKDSLLKTLSYGQRQRVALIRALCQPFDFLLLDEPFSHLDDENVAICTDLINQELTQNNAGLLVTSLGENHSFNYHKIFCV